MSSKDKKAQAADGGGTSLDAFREDAGGEVDKRFKNKLKVEDFDEFEEGDEITLSEDGKANAARSLSMLIEQKNYKNSMLSLTNPKLYATYRMNAFDAVVDAVNDAYEETFNQMSRVGMPEDACKQGALEAARRVKEVRMATFRMEFPDSANAISRTQMETKNDAYAGAPPGKKVAIGGTTIGGRRGPNKRK